MPFSDRIWLWIAQGFGSGRLRPAPGTWGSLVGVAWFLLLCTGGSLLVYAAGCLAGLAVSVRACDAAERVLGRKDPSSVVIDEIAAMPLCYLGLFLIRPASPGGVPPPGAWFEGAGPWLLAGGFLAFRLFDIWKPGPIRRSQDLAGGWGVTADDVLAALTVNLVWLVLAPTGLLR